MVKIGTFWKNQGGSEGRNYNRLESVKFDTKNRSIYQEDFLYE